MKRFLAFFIAVFIFTSPCFSAGDKLSEDYLKNNKNPIKMSFVGENIVKSALKHALKKEAPGKYKVKFKGYTLSSLKKGIFKYLEVTGKNVNFDGVEIPYFNVKTLTDYNWVDYNQEPIVFKSDINLDCELHLNEKSINDTLETDEYEKVLCKINTKIFPMISISNVKVKINDNKMHVKIFYNFPLAPREKDKHIMISTGLKVVNNKICTYDVAFDKLYGSNLPLQKVTNLVNLLNPLNFVIKLIDGNQGEGKIEDIKIIDDIVIINGKIYIKGENK